MAGWGGLPIWCPGLASPCPSRLSGTDNVSGPAPNGRHAILASRAQIQFHKLWIDSGECPRIPSHMCIKIRD